MNNRRYSSNPNRDMDYTQSQYGADRMRTQNTSSSYANDYANQGRMNPELGSNTDDRSFLDYQDWQGEASETFLDEYRMNHGLMGSDERRNFSDRDEEFHFRHSGDYGNKYIAKSDEGFLESMKEKVKNFFGKGPKGYKRSDERIREEVCEILYRHPHIDASEIEVDVKDGIVTLKGQVENRRMKRYIEDEIEHCHGVQDIDNQLRLTSSRISENSMDASVQSH